jgi:K+-sensing histidine kinase KdpD
MALACAESLTRQHKVEIEIETELPLVQIDARAVAEVIYLLVDNATKYSPPSTSIRVAASRISPEFLQLSVEDEGCGIPQHSRESVFDKFFRATPDYPTALQRPSGMGMGLAIARGIVEAHGGRIWLEDGTGDRGTRVSFTMPIGDDKSSDSADERKGLTGGVARPQNRVIRTVL